MQILKPALQISAVLIGTAYGFVSSLRKFRQLEFAEDPESPLTWHEGPFRTLLLDKSQGFLIVLNDLTVAVMASLLLKNAITYERQEFLHINDSYTQYEVLLISAGILGLAWWGVGPALVSLITGLTKRRIIVSITDSGVRWGIARLPWTSFSRYDADSGSSKICLYSAYCPDLCTISVIPPDRQIWERAIEYIRHNLPKSSQLIVEKAARHKIWFFLEITGLCLAGLLISVFLYQFQTLWSQFLQMTSILFLIQARSAVFRRYIGIVPGNRKNSGHSLE